MNKAARLKSPQGSGTGVCIIDENNPVPKDNRVWKEACALRDAGYQVSVVCPQGQPGCAARFQRIDGIDIYRHRSFAAAGPSGHLFEYVCSLAAEFCLTLKIYARKKFRILQACNPPDTTFLIALFFKLLGVRFVFDHHDLVPELFEAKFGTGGGVLLALARWAERLTFQTADVTLAANETFREVAVSRGKKNPDRVFVVRNYPNLADIRRMPPDPALKNGKAFLVAYLGIMNSQDGVDTLLQSVRHMVRSEGRRDTHFVLIGDGGELCRLRTMSREWGLEPFVTFTGWLSRAEIDRFLSTADVAVSPDPCNPLNHASTMIKTLEYMAYGCPIVQFDLIEGRRSAGDASLYARSSDPVDFAHEISRLLDSELLRQELRRKALARVESQITWAAEKASLLKAYETIREEDGKMGSASRVGGRPESGKADLKRAA